jgi:hypothetical protein
MGGRMNDRKRWMSMAKKCYAAQWIIAREDATRETEVWHWMYLAMLRMA